MNESINTFRCNTTKSTQGWIEIGNWVFPFRHTKSDDKTFKRFVTWPVAMRLQWKEMVAYGVCVKSINVWISNGRLGESKASLVNHTISILRPTIHGCIGTLPLICCCWLWMPCGCYYHRQNGNVLAHHIQSQLDAIRLLLWSVDTVSVCVSRTSLHSQRRISCELAFFNVHKHQTTTVDLHSLERGQQIAVKLQLISFFSPFFRSINHWVQRIGCQNREWMQRNVSYGNASSPVFDSQIKRFEFFSWKSHSNAPGLDALQFHFSLVQFM